MNVFTVSDRYLRCQFCCCCCESHWFPPNANNDTHAHCTASQSSMSANDSATIVRMWPIVYRRFLHATSLRYTCKCSGLCICVCVLLMALVMERVNRNKHTMNQAVKTDRTKRYYSTRKLEKKNKRITRRRHEDNEKRKKNEKKNTN